MVVWSDSYGFVMLIMLQYSLCYIIITRHQTIHTYKARQQNMKQPTEILKYASLCLRILHEQELLTSSYQIRVKAIFCIVFRQNCLKISPGMV